MPNNKITSQLNKLSKIINEIDRLYSTIFQKLKYNKSNFKDKKLSDLLCETDQMRNNISDVFVIARYNRITLFMRDNGLSKLKELSFNWDLEPELFLKHFKYSWYKKLVDYAYEENQSIIKFDRISQEKAINDFQYIDNKLSLFSQEKIALMHYENLPYSDAGGEVALITKEINKKRRHLPIRQLLLKSGRVIQQIKPVFMMSPMSVATFLAQGDIEFDLVIFDEASQVKIVDALIPILRGKQIVVVGDSKQMPPTDFFNRSFENDENDEESVTGNIESILTMFLAKGAEEKMLKWHYRSKHDSLINVSNQEFYKGKLMIFPNSGRNTNAKGLKFNYLPETVYERGTSRTNPLEARAVAESVIDFVKLHPRLSLGVVAFSTVQRDRIIMELEMLRKQNPNCEPFFNSNKQEEFFIKNLENVQGDERDVIFISIGYGKTVNGRFPKNFGPLNREGGERRLNVLITRARLSMEVFCNFTSDDLEVTSKTPFGVKVLKSFIKYAKTKILENRFETGKETDSPFEDEVIIAIQDLGYDVEPQVGSAGFFIDIAIKDPNKPGKYVLAVECDGASYHSAASARDRDRLRQNVLEGMGWEFHRIWSTDWFRDSKKEIERLKISIEKALISDNSPTSKKKKIDKVETIYIDRGLKKKEFEKPNKYKLSFNRFSTGNYYEISEMSNKKISKIISKIINIEGAIHIKEITRRIVDELGGSRITAKMINLVKEGAKFGVNNGFGFYYENSFVYEDRLKIVKIRDRSQLDSYLRKIEFVPEEEIELAIIKTIKLSFSISKKESVKEVLSLLGFNRVTDNTSRKVVYVLDNLILQKSIIDNDDLLKINDI